MWISAVVCDVGVTLVDESALWSELADQVGVSRFTFMATLGGLIARGRDHREIWDELGIDRPRYWPEHAASDLYPDAAEFLKDLRRLGITVGIAGNQPERTESLLKDMRPSGGFRGLVDRMGCGKASPEFFTKLVDVCGCAPEQVLYVGIASTTTSSCCGRRTFDLSYSSGSVGSHPVTAAGGEDRHDAGRVTG